MTSKTKKHLRWIPSVLAGFFIIPGAVLKLLHAPQMAELFSRTTMQSYMAWFGVIELLFIALFLIPRTMKMGLLLLTAYYGGAVATEISIGGMPVIPALLLGIIWIAAFLRDQIIFPGKTTVTY